MYQLIPVAYMIGVLLVVFILLFAIGWQLDNGASSFVLFSLAFCILIYLIFINKKNENFKY